MKKHRLSLTLDAGLVQKIDKIVDGLYIKSRSDFIEQILKKYIEQDNTAVILCGGDRFFLEGTNLPRPLIPILDKKIITYNIEILRKHGFSNIFVLGKGAVLNMVAPILEKESGINVMYLTEETPLGSAKILLKLKKYVHTRFLVLPGDCLFDFDLGDMLDFHKSHGKISTLAIHALKKPSREHYKLAWVHLKGTSVIGCKEVFSEDVEDNTLYWTGISLFEPSVFNYIGKESGRFDLGELTTLLVKDKQAKGYLMHGFWFNIHTNDDIKDASLVLRSQKSL